MSYHAIYVFQLFSCLVVFLLAYNFSLLVESERTVIDILLTINVLALGYCALQLSAGPGVGFVPFGIDALEFNKNRHAGDARLVGPFDNPGSTAGYFTLMLMVCAVELTFSQGRRRLLVQALILLNLVAIVATGNRAGFLVMVAMFPVLLLLFKKELGARRVTQYLVGGVAVLAIASAVVISYTGFGRMFERLGDVTETENGVPMTRTLTWPIAIEKIKEHPWVGEGPFFVDPETANQLGWLRSEMSPYPHSLYLFLLRTIGVVGLIPFVWFFIQAWRLLYAKLKRGPVNDYSSALLRLGLILIIAFLIAQITLEFNRTTTIDYTQFIFALVGLLVGIADRPPRTMPIGAPVQSDIVPAARRMSRDGPVAS
jgi:O-antigen ligase